MDNGNPIEQVITMLQGLAQEGVIAPEKVEQVIAILSDNETEEPMVDEDQERREAEELFGTKFINN